MTTFFYQMPAFFRERNDEDDTEEPEPADNVAVVGTRNRPKREE